MKTILIIEDHPQMRRNIATILELEGFKVVTAEDGREGIKAAQAERPDLILCDIMMPELDGHSVLQALRADKNLATIPFIFLTAKGEKADQRTGMNLGADDYLAKPIAAEELLQAVAARLARQNLQEEHLQEKVADATGFNPNFESATPLQEQLHLTPREAEVLLWVAQGKSNSDIGIICVMAEKTVKKHLTSVFEKLGVESRNAATLRALEVLSNLSRPSV